MLAVCWSGFGVAWWGPVTFLPISQFSPSFMVARYLCGSSSDSAWNDVETGIAPLQIKGIANVPIVFTNRKPVQSANQNDKMPVGVEKPVHGAFYSSGDFFAFLPQIAWSWGPRAIAFTKNAKPIHWKPFAFPVKSKVRLDTERKARLALQGNGTKIASMTLMRSYVTPREECKVLDVFVCTSSIRIRCFVFRHFSSKVPLG